jgi:hypothetical protein
MSSMSETLGHGRLETPRWLVIAIAIATVGILVTAAVRTPPPPAPIPTAERAPAAVYPASGRAEFHEGLLRRPSLGPALRDGHHPGTVRAGTDSANGRP